MNNKGRKFHFTLVISCFVMLPCLAIATPPSGNSDMSVGEVEAILDACIKVDANLGKNSEAMRNALTGHASPGVRGTAGYKEGYDLVTDALAKLGKAQVQAACSSLGAPDKDHAAKHGHRPESRR